MNKLEADRLKENGGDELTELKSYHAREVVAMRAAHANQMFNLKDHSDREVVRLKQEIARLERVIAGLERVVNGLKVQPHPARPARKSRPRRKK